MRKNVSFETVNRFFRYNGSLFFLILMCLIWLPLGVFLFFKNGQYIKNNVIYYYEYNGSWRWVIFWAIVFFPISIVLLLFNGGMWIERR